LRQTGIFEAPALVVDLGWHGSLQRSLLKLGRTLTGAAVELDGVYLGTSKATHSPGGADALHTWGWLFDKGEPAEAFLSTVGRSFEVIELLFSAPHPGISHVRLVDGAPTPVYAHDPAETHRLKIAALIHREVASAAAELRHLIPLVSAREWREIALDQLSSLLAGPDGNDVEHFQPILHSEGFGLANYKPIIPIASRGMKPRSIFAAREEAFWRSGFEASLSGSQRLMLLLGATLDITSRMPEIARDRLIRRWTRSKGS
jgi:hypothetical protein